MCLFSASIMALEAALPATRPAACATQSTDEVGRSTEDRSDARSRKIFFLENAYLFQCIVRGRPWILVCEKDLRSVHPSSQPDIEELSGKSAGQEGRG